MKTSELIERLNKYLKEYGDLPCVNSLNKPVSVFPCGYYDYNDNDQIMFE